MNSIDLNAVSSPQQLKAGGVGRTETNQLRLAIAPKTISGPARADSVNVSRVSVKVGELVDRAQGLNDVRQDRVDSLRQLVESGRYNVSSQQIAAAILREEN